VIKRQRASAPFHLLCRVRAVTFAQNASVQAEAAYEAKNWSEATKLYSDLADSNPALARYWYRRGVAAQASLGPDKVRQFSQGSKDDGKTWSVEYDSTYER
jgi:hypothetical protein